MASETNTTNASIYWQSTQWSFFVASFCSIWRHQLWILSIHRGNDEVPRHDNAELTMGFLRQTRRSVCTRRRQASGDWGQNSTSKRDKLQPPSWYWLWRSDVRTFSSPVGAVKTMTHVSYWAKHDWNDDGNNKNIYVLDIWQNDKWFTYFEYGVRRWCKSIQFMKIQMWFWLYIQVVLDSPCLADIHPSPPQFS